MFVVHIKLQKIEMLIACNVMLFGFRDEQKVYIYIQFNAPDVESSDYGMHCLLFCINSMEKFLYIV